MAENQFGKYHLLKKVGTGGMAELFLARQSGIEGFEKLIVIKRILPHLENSKNFIQMFLDEARLAARLNHPNIVQIYDMGCVQGQYFIAMEYVNGVDLSLIMRKERKLGRKIPIAHAVKILSYVCEALTYAHNQRDTRGNLLGLVHRDISPHNVLVAFEGGVKLTDFGIAKASSHAVKTKAGTLKGKYAFMSPEQCLGKDIDSRSDIFTMGILLYTMTTGELPFTGGSEFSALHAIIHKAPRPPAVVRENFPVGLIPVMERVLAKNPQDRFPDALSLQMALENFLMEEKAVSNATLIGQYVSELFDDLIDAQTRTSPGGKTATIEGILSAIEVKKETVRLTPSSPQQRARPSPRHTTPDTDSTEEATCLLVTPSQVIDAPETVPTRPAARTPPSGRRWPILVILAAGFLTTFFGALIVHLLVRSDRDEGVSPDEPVHAAAAAALPPYAGAARGDARTEAADRPPVAAMVAVDAGAAPDGGDGQAGADGAEEPGSRGKKVAATAPSRKKKVAKKSGVGFLTINTNPWSEVWVGNRKLGLTPLAYKKLPAGRHKVILRNRPLGIKKTVWIRIRPGKTTPIEIDLARK